MEATYIQHMGSDLTVVNAARVSFHKESEWENNPVVETCKTCDCTEMLGHEGYCEKKLSEADQKLIRYLANHEHFTPFTHVQITLREKVPIFVARQRFKHMVGFSYNEVSRRYVSDAPEFFIPTEWRKKAENKKQGSSDEVIHEFTKGIYASIGIREAYDDFIDAAGEFYASLIDEGVAPEQARMVLPQSMYTEYMVTGSLAAWARAYKLRIDTHSQLEIQNLAKEWGRIIGSLKELEHSWRALTT